MAAMATGVPQEAAVVTESGYSVINFQLLKNPPAPLFDLIYIE